MIFLTDAVTPPEFGTVNTPETLMGNVGQTAFKGLRSMLPTKLSFECNRQISSTYAYPKCPPNPQRDAINSTVNSSLLGIEEISSNPDCQLAVYNVT